jgi:hypothetical protein
VTLDFKTTHCPILRTPMEQTEGCSVFNPLTRLRCALLHAIYVLEPGLAEENPRLLTTKIIGVGGAPA